MTLAPALLEPSPSEIENTDLIELYFERGWTDGLPVVPPTQDKINCRRAGPRRRSRLRRSARSLRAGVR